MDVGLFGKLPSHGDFLRRRVPDAFVDAWDSWLRECLPASRNVLGERWLDLYLTSPAWRFICAAGTCGPAPVIGLMVPSVDRVGRYFPLTLVTQLPPGASLARTDAGGHGRLAVIQQALHVFVLVPEGGGRGLFRGRPRVFFSVLLASVA